jgi:hypothetical protein
MSAVTLPRFLSAALAYWLIVGLCAASAQDAKGPLTGPVFIATGEDGLRVFSRDGITWTHLQTDREGVLLQHACFLEGRCLAAGRYGGDRMAFVTTDGVKWESIKLEGQPYAVRLDTVYVAGKRFHAVLYDDASKFAVITSADGKTWLPRQSILRDWKVLRYDTHLRRCAQGNDRVVLVGDYGARLVQQAGADKFEAVPKALARDTLIDIAFGNGVFVGGGLHGLRMRSKDGLAWNDRIVGEEGEHINSMIFDGKQFVGIGQGATYFSPDGLTWTRTPNTSAPTVAAFGQGIYVGSLWPGKLLRSTDAVHWKQVHELPHHVFALAYGQLGRK